MRLPISTIVSQHRPTRCIHNDVWHLPQPAKNLTPPWTSGNEVVACKRIPLHVDNPPQFEQQSALACGIVVATHIRHYWDWPLISGVAITSVGVTNVFVPEDLTFLQMNASAARCSSSACGSANSPSRSMPDKSCPRGVVSRPGPPSSTIMPAQSGPVICCRAYLTTEDHLYKLSVAYLITPDPTPYRAAEGTWGLAYGSKTDLPEE
jgi:hypothetical protein